MSGALSNLVVIVAIAVSLCYAVWRLGPRKMRDALRAKLNLKASAATGCDACSGGGCAPTTKQEPGARKEHAVIWRKQPR
jgi:hypothetical protein